MSTHGTGGDGFGPDDVIDLTRRARKGANRYAGLIIGVLALLVLAVTSYTQIEPAEVGLVLRFGKYARTLESGPHWTLPLGLERVVKVKAQRQHKEEFGFRSVHDEGATRYVHDEETERESLMLTGDLQVANVEWIVQYKIQDPYAYTFKVRDVVGTFRAMSEAAVRQVVGDHSVHEVITIGREEIQAKTKERLQEMCNQYETGIEVVQLILQDVNPPKPVRPSFNEVNAAQQERERMINEAKAEYNRVIPEARGKARQHIQGAHGYATERVNRARGDAERFRAIRTEYAKAPAVTRTRLYLEAMAEVLPSAGRRILVDSSLKGIVPLLSLGGTAEVPR